VATASIAPSGSSRRSKQGGYRAPASPTKSVDVGREREHAPSCDGPRGEVEQGGESNLRFACRFLGHGSGSRRGARVPAAGTHRARRSNASARDKADVGRPSRASRLAQMSKNSRRARPEDPTSAGLRTRVAGHPLPDPSSISTEPGWKAKTSSQRRADATSAVDGPPVSVGGAANKPARLGAHREPIQEGLRRAHERPPGIDRGLRDDRVAQVAADRDAGSIGISPGGERQPFPPRAAPAARKI